MIKSVGASSVIPKFDTIFARHEIPKKVTADNGSPFQGAEVKRYTTELGIYHQRTTPLSPQGNSEEEAFNNHWKKPSELHKLKINHGSKS